MAGLLNTGHAAKAAKQEKVCGFSAQAEIPFASSIIVFEYPEIKKIHVTVGTTGTWRNG